MGFFADMEFVMTRYGLGWIGLGGTEFLVPVLSWLLFYFLLLLFTFFSNSVIL